MNELIEKTNPLCVISKETFGDYAVRDIQTNSIWTCNPYGKDYAIVPDNMIQDILQTNGFCDIELNEDGTEIISFTTKEIPKMPIAERKPTIEERLAALEMAMLEQIGVVAE